MKALVLTRGRGRRASVVECGPAGPLWAWAQELAGHSDHVHPLSLVARSVESAAAAGALQNGAEGSGYWVWRRSFPRQSLMMIPLDFGVQPANVS